MAKYTDEQIKKALEEVSSFGDSLCSGAFDLINRQEAEIAEEKAKKEISAEVIKRQEAEIERLRESHDKTIYKLELLLCYSTGSRLSKHSYELKTMYDAVNDYIQKCCEDAKSEAIKEFAERLKEHEFFANFTYRAETQRIVDILVGEMVGEGE